MEEPLPDSTYVMSKSAGSAILWSLVFPGLGQIYVESYWKAPFFMAGAGVLIYNIIDNNSNFIDIKDEISRLDENSSTYSKSLDSLKGWREVYRDNRDQSAFFLLAVYLLASVDAYVGAHLFDFTVDDNLAILLLPSRRRGLCLNLRFRW